MNIVVTGGGTAGHVNPALALAQEMISRGHTVVYAGTPDGIEQRLAEGAGLEFKAFDSAGFDRSKPWTLPASLFRIAKSRRQAKLWLADRNIDAVVGFGGYASIPSSYAALDLHIPLIVHEQNSYMGAANAVFAKKGALCALTYKEAAYKKGNIRTVITGNPVRDAVIFATREAGRKYFSIPDDHTVLVVFGGSLGARHINQTIVALKDELLQREKLTIIHITGDKLFDEVSTSLALTPEEAKRWRVYAYQDHMAEVLASADCVIARAGATSLAEIAVRNLPALLIPFPYATDDHQTKNAHSMVQRGVAYMVADKDIEGDDFRAYVFDLVDSLETRKRMSDEAAKHRIPNAAKLLADAVEAEVRSNV